MSKAIKGSNDNSTILEWGNYVLFESNENLPFARINGHDFFKKDLSSYNEFFSVLYKKIDGENLCIGETLLEEKIIDLFFQLKSNPDLTFIIKEEIEKIPLKKSHVLLPIFNAHLFERKITLGNYTVVQYQSIPLYCTDCGLTLSMEESDKLCCSQFFTDVPFVDIPVETRDLDFASILARKKMRAFVSFLKYALFSNIRGDIDILSDYNTFIAQESYIITNENVVFTQTPNPIGVKWFDLSSKLNDLVVLEMNGNKRILDIIEKQSDCRDEIENRILNAINWLGMAISEKNNAVSFTQAIFSVECLLQYQQSKEPISKSIVATIGEAIAFLVGSSLEERSDLERRFKDLYGIRSSIAHGKGKPVSDIDVLDAIDLSKRVIVALLTKSELKSAKTFQSVSNYIKRMRYTCN